MCVCACACSAHMYVCMCVSVCTNVEPKCGLREGELQPSLSHNRQPSLKPTQETGQHHRAEIQNRWLLPKVFIPDLDKDHLTSTVEGKSNVDPPTNQGVGEVKMGEVLALHHKVSLVTSYSRISSNVFERKSKKKLSKTFSCVQKCH